MEVCAPPSDVLERLLRQRPLWQTDVLEEKVLETLDRQTDIYQYSLQSMAPHPNTDYVVLRLVHTITHASQLPSHRWFWFFNRD